MCQVHTPRTEPCAQTMMAHSEHAYCYSTVSLDEVAALLGCACTQRHYYKDRETSQF